MLLSLAGKTILAGMTAAAIKVKRVKITPPNPVVPVGGRVQFRMDAFNYFGNKLPAKDYRWEVVDPSPEGVGSITRDGVFTAKTPGTATIEGTVLNLTGADRGTTSVTVVEANPGPHIVSLSVYPSQLVLPAGYTMQFVAVAAGVQGYPEDVPVTWSVRVDGRATPSGSITTEGLFTALQAGDEPVLVEAAAGDKTAEVEVQIDQPPASFGDLAALAVSPQFLLLKEGGKQRFVAQGLDADGRFVPLTNVVWSAGGGIGEIDPTTGELTAVTAGVGSVTATVGDVAGEAQVQVETGD